jgi:hypothetical protein
MPYNESKSLSPDEMIYAVVAYVLNLNGAIGDTDVINAQTLPNVKMPNRDGFVPFHPVAARQRWRLPRKRLPSRNTSAVER